MMTLSSLGIFPPNMLRLAPSCDCEVPTEALRRPYGVPTTLAPFLLVVQVLVVLYQRPGLRNTTSGLNSSISRFPVLNGTQTRNRLFCYPQVISSKNRLLTMAMVAHPPSCLPSHLLQLSDVRASPQGTCTLARKPGRLCDRV